MTEEKYLKTLEFLEISKKLADCAICEDAKSKAMAVLPSSKFYEASRELNMTVGANTLSNKYGYPNILKTENCALNLHRAQMGGSLTLKELLAISKVLKTMRNLDSYRKQSDGENPLDYLFECLYINRDLESKLNNSIISEDELDDNASPALSDIRRKIRNAALKVRNQLDSMIKSQTFQKYLQEPIVTIRDGRFVVPVKSEYRNEVKGLIHDTSASGASLFIEPMSVVELNNEIRVLENKEQLEIERIIAELSSLAGDCAEQINAGYMAAAELDFCFAKSRLADKMKANIPILTESGETNLKKARHPFIPYEKAVPIDIAVGKDYDTLVITGPNTGGKTVAIKTLGLLSLMASAGLMIPASSASVVTIYENILADIGDEQSIEQSLSTFSAHMKNIISIVEKAGNGSLVLLDELGAGTDPVEGAALAVSIIETLRGQGAHVAATTHYPEIKLYALKTDGVENASCEFDVESLRPTYRLLTGIPGRSNAFLISEKLGLSRDIIENAKGLVSGENTRFEDVVNELEEMRQNLIKEKEETENLKQQAIKIKQNAENEKKILISRTGKDLEAAKKKALSVIEEAKISADILFEELDAIKKEKDAEKFNKLLNNSKVTYRQTMRELTDKADPVAKTSKENKLTRPLEKGDIVYIETLGKEGLVIKKPDGDKVMVQAGILKTTVSISDVTLGEAKKPSRRQVKAASRGVTSINREVMTEVSLRGMDSVEAIMTLDNFIDRAVLQKVPTIRIVHGKGTGVLRAAVQKRLKSHKAIKEFRLGRYGEGEDGVTIATLK